MLHHALRALAGAVALLTLVTIAPTDGGGNVAAQEGDPGRIILWRWMDDAETRGGARAARFDGIDFVACGQQTCGIALGADGACGAVVMRIVFRNARDGNTDAPPFIRYVGSMTWGDRPLDATLTLDRKSTRLNSSHT